jgi:putative peptidoglycan lipid II flippase
MVGLTLGFSSEFLLRRLSGFLGPGAVAEASYAFRLTMVLVGFFGQAAGVASYPFLVELATSGRWNEMQALLRRSIGQLVVALVPASALTCLFAPELVGLAFRRGAFDETAVQAVALPLRWMVWAVLPWSVQIVLSRALFARDRFWFSAGLGTVVVLVAWPLWALLVHHYGKSGVGPGLLLLVGLQAAAFAAAWVRSPRGIDAFDGFFRLLGEVLVVSVPVSLLARWGADATGGGLAGAAAWGALAVAFLAGAGWWRRWPGARDLLGKVGSRFRRRSRNPS